MNEPTVKVTFKEIALLLKEWFVTEGREQKSDLRVRTMRALTAAGVIEDLGVARAAMDARTAEAKKTESLADGEKP